MTEPAVQIGAAAALYDLAPSTLRWWERQGVLNPPGRDGHRRTYRTRDLRRIGLAYLCCVTGMMPLDRAAVVTSGNASRRAWQRTVTDQIARLERRIRAMEAARDYLRHLLSCEDDDITECPLLDRELVAHTPRGRVPEPDLVVAARVADTLGNDAPPRDENAVEEDRCDEKRCVSCGRTVRQPRRGRPRRYCSHACRQRAYRARRAR